MQFCPCYFEIIKAKTEKPILNRVGDIKLIIMSCIAFSAECKKHTSYGDNSLDKDIIEYNRTILNEGNHWDGRDFTAPEDGCYHFTINFVKDGYSSGGTQDDVYVALYHMNTHVGSAWSGQGDRRSTGCLSVNLKLKVGDKIKTYAQSDGGRARNIVAIYISGFKI